MVPVSGKFILLICKVFAKMELSKPRVYSKSPEDSSPRSPKKIIF